MLTVGTLSVREDGKNIKRFIYRQLSLGGFSEIIKRIQRVWVSHRVIKVKTATTLQYVYVIQYQAMISSTPEPKTRPFSSSFYRECVAATKYFETVFKKS